MYVRLICGRQNPSLVNGAERIQFLVAPDSIQQYFTLVQRVNRLKRLAACSQSPLLPGSSR